MLGGVFHDVSGSMSQNLYSVAVRLSEPQDLLALALASRYPKLTPRNEVPYD